MPFHDLGQDTIYGNRAMGCEHMAEWLPWFTRMGIARGLIHHDFDLSQAQGGAAASAGTHLEGTCLDFSVVGRGEQWVLDVAHLARECGMPATWPRGDAGGVHWDSAFAGNNHIHGVLDCPCWSHADYQIDAVKAGYNGLGYEGHGAPDPIRRPDTWRNWESGIAYMRSQLEATPATSSPTSIPKVVAHAVTTTTSTNTTGDDVALSDQDVDRIADAVFKKMIYTPFDRSKLTMGAVLERAYWTLPGVMAYLQKIATKLGVK